MNFFKLPKPVWKLSDDEYVGRIRMANQRLKPWLKLIRIVWLLIVVAAALVSVKMVEFALDHPAGPKMSPVVLAYCVAAMAGWLMGFTLLTAVFLNVEVWTMERTNRIMVSSWDRMKELEQVVKADTEVTPRTADSPKP